MVPTVLVVHARARTWLGWSGYSVLAVHVAVVEWL